MAESIRSLTVKLGYDIDTTGANIFRSNFNELQKSLRKGANLSGFAKNFNARFNEAGKSIRGNAKRVLAGIAIAIAAGVAAATKVFTGFATIEQARVSLQFRAGDKFDELIKKIDKTREATGNVVSELDALNAFNLGADVIGDFDFLANNFGTVIKLAKVLGKDVGEVQQAFANFISTGSNLQELVKFGFFSPEQIEALKKAGTDFSQQGLETRKALLGAKIAEGAPKLDIAFEDFSRKSRATIDRLGAAAENLTTVVGEKLAPAINETATGLANSMTRAKETLDKGGGLFGAWLESFQSDSARKFINLFKDTPLILSGNQQGGNVVNDNSVTNINVHGAGDPEAVARNVESKIAKKVINSSVRRTTPQSLNTTIQPER